MNIDYIFLRLDTRPFRCNSCIVQPNTFCRPFEISRAGRQSGQDEDMFGPLTEMRIPANLVGGRKPLSQWSVGSRHPAKTRGPARI
jgi:hypothetical protein